jgi:hypothetical protein
MVVLEQVPTMKTCQSSVCIEDKKGGREENQNLSLAFTPIYLPFFNKKTLLFLIFVQLIYCFCFFYHHCRLGALAAGWVCGSVCVPVIPTVIIPPTWTLELMTSLVSYLFLFLGCTFLK